MQPLMPPNHQETDAMQTARVRANARHTDTPDASMPEQELLNQMIAEAVEYVHGKARPDIIKQLETAENTSETIAAVTYKLSRGLIDRHKKQGMALDIEMDVAMGLATEVIDMQMELLERVAPDAMMNEQVIREDALLRTLMIHAEEVDSPEAKEQAQTMLAGFMQDGTVDTAFNYINQRAAREGINVDDMIRQGDKLAAGSVGGGQTPVAAGVGQALMPPQPPQAPAGAPPNHTETPEMMTARVRATARR